MQDKKHGRQQKQKTDDSTDDSISALNATEPSPVYEMAVASQQDHLINSTC